MLSRLLTILARGECLASAQKNDDRICATLSHQKVSGYHVASLQDGHPSKSPADAFLSDTTSTATTDSSDDLTSIESVYAWATCRCKDDATSSSADRSHGIGHVSSIGLRKCSGVLMQRSFDLEYSNPGSCFAVISEQLTSGSADERVIKSNALWGGYYTPQQHITWLEDNRALAYALPSYNYVCNSLPGNIRSQISTARSTLVALAEARTLKAES